jgi:hypothetical protein
VGDVQVNVRVRMRVRVRVREGGCACGGWGSFFDEKQGRVHPDISLAPPYQPTFFPPGRPPGGVRVRVRCVSAALWVYSCVTHV